MPAREEFSRGRSVLPNLFGHGHDARQSFQPLTLGRREPRSPALECGARRHEVAKRLDLNGIVLCQMRQQSVNRSFGKAFGHDIVEIVERPHAMLERA
jgi:hypothetical protein